MIRCALATWSLGALVAVLVVTGCATARSGSGGDGGGPGVDSKPGAADAPPGTPDAPGAPDGNTCSKQPCSLTPQCGCGASMACDLDSANLSTGGTLCRASGTGGETTTCTTDTACLAGYSCVGGRCQKWCGGDGDCTTGPGAICAVQVTYGSPPMNIPGAIVCSTDCDASSKTPAGCPAGWGCHIYQEQGGAMRFLTDCDTAGAGGAGASCTTNGSRDCQAGMDCINVTRGTTTTAECHPSCVCPSNNCAAGTCPSGTGSCNAFQTPVMVGTREYGTCL